eukprot:7011473-Prorocentrum_lima.AAC.1
MTRPDKRPWPHSVPPHSLFSFFAHPNAQAPQQHLQSSLVRMHMQGFRSPPFTLNPSKEA